MCEAGENRKMYWPEDILTVLTIMIKDYHRLVNITGKFHRMCVIVLLFGTVILPCLADDHTDGFLSDDNPCNDHYANNDALAYVCQCVLDDYGLYELECDSQIELSQQFNYSTVNFASMPLNNVSHDMFSNRSIQKLVLQDCNISWIHDNAFNKIDGIRYLDISNNRLTDDIIFALRKAPTLYSLNIGNNNYQDLDVKTLIKTLPNLFILGLNSSNLRTFPRLRGQGRLIRKLSLAWNSLDDKGIKNVASLPNLEALDLSFNNLRNFESSTLIASRRLQSLSLVGNGIVAVPDLWLPNLRTLNLSYNLITSPPSERLSRSIYLNTIDLRNNNITMLDNNAFCGIKPHSTSKTLILSSNPVSHISACAFKGYAGIVRIRLSRLKARLPCECGVAMIVASRQSPDVSCWDDRNARISHISPGDKKWSRNVCPNIASISCESFRQCRLNDVNYNMSISYSSSSRSRYLVHAYYIQYRFLPASVDAVCRLAGMWLLAFKACMS